MVILVLISILALVHAWDIGYYQDGTDWYPWHSSCKQWVNANQWTDWEIYMFLNTTTNVCEYWADGEYYDFSVETCQTCTSSWTGYWGHQASCFQCSPSEKFDLDTLQWVSDWDADYVSISNSTQYEIASFCRSLEFYIDPSSNELIELGTKTYPYRTLSPALAEILNYFSHTDKEVSIYLKEGTENSVYLEDATAYFLNLTTVSILSYSDSSPSSPGKAFLITTDNSIEKLSKKAAFHIMKSFNLEISSVIGSPNSDLSDNEKVLIENTANSFMVVRTSLSIKDVIIKRKASTIEGGLLFYMIYLQRKTMTLSKYLNRIGKNLIIADMEIYVTGKIMIASDPMNVEYHNVFVDTYQVEDGFNFEPNWNYPEAFLTPTVNIDNFTLHVSNFTDNESNRPIPLDYTGPGNFSAKNVDLTSLYRNAIQGKGTFIVSVRGGCTPNDGEYRLIYWENMKISLRDNTDHGRTNAMAVVIDVAHDRNAVINFTNIEADDFGGGIYGTFLYIGSYGEEFHQSHSSYKNFGGQSNVILLSRASKYFSSLYIITYKYEFI